MVSTHQSRKHLLIEQKIAMATFDDGSLSIDL
jgi:hypothetical protein